MAVPWRRLSSPCLETQPWTSALVDGQLHLLKGVFREDAYEISVWDMSVMWVEKVEREALTERMTNLNPNIEAPVTLILSHLSTLLQAPFTTYTKATPTVGSEGKTLVVNGTLSGLPFTWQFQCQPSASHMIQLHLISPLLSIVKELCRQKIELVSIIKRKDREIQDYKDGGASVSRRHLETTSFDEKAFNTAMSLSEEFERSVQNSTEVLKNEEFQSLYRNVGMVSVWKEREKLEGPYDEAPAAAMSCDSTTGTWAEKIPSSLLPASQSPSVPTSASHSPAKRPPDTPPAKDEELDRREALEKKLEEERVRGKKKKKRLM